MLGLCIRILLQKLFDQLHVDSNRIVLTPQDMSGRFRILPFRNFLEQAEVRQKEGRRARFSCLTTNVGSAFAQLGIEALTNPQHVETELCFVVALERHFCVRER